MEERIFKVKVENLDVVLEAKEGTILSTLLRKHGIEVPRDCGGGGKCGRCAVIINGENVLSCQIRINSDLNVVLDAGIKRTENQTKEKETYPNKKDSKTNVAAIIDIGTTIVKIEYVEIEPRQNIVEKNEGSKTKGSRTVSHRINRYSILDKWEIKGTGYFQSFVNPQRAYGDDIVSRYIDFKSRENRETIRKITVDEISRQLGRVLYESNYELQFVIVMGNPTMIAMFLGEPCSWFFTDYSIDLSSEKITKKINKGMISLKKAGINIEMTNNLNNQTDNGLHVTPNGYIDCPLYIVPAISAFVGGDFVSGFSTIETSTVGENTNSPSDSRFCTIDASTVGENSKSTKDLDSSTMKASPIGKNSKTTSNPDSKSIETSTVGENSKSTKDLDFSSIEAGTVGESDSIINYCISHFNTMCNRRRAKHKIFMDIGTNVELGIVGANSMFVTSTPAGPCFEGSGISHGMPATSGAICSYKIDEKGIPWIETINSLPQVGICGSGLIDIIAELVKEGIITKKGKLVGERKQTNILKSQSEYEENNQESKVLEQSIGKAPKKRNKKESEYQICKGITISQRDVTSFLYAKSAIRTAITILLEKQGVGYDNIEEVIIAGGFARHLREESLIGTGIIPAALSKKITFSMDASLEGGKQIIKKGLDNVTHILNSAKYVYLPLEEDFIDNFVKGCIFNS